MNSSSTITILGVALLLVYGITRILEFYGIGINVYGSYLAFYLFLLLSAFVLPRYYRKFRVGSVASPSTT
jgi:branched-subunit amino acid ABC-type transport system permease component